MVFVPLFIVFSISTVVAFICSIFWGARRKFLRRASFFSLVAAVVSFIAIGGAALNDKDSAPEAPVLSISPPEVHSQDRFCDVLNRYRDAFKAASDNDVAKIAADQERMTRMPGDLAAVLASETLKDPAFGIIVGWKVEVSSLTVREDNAIRLVLDAPCEIDLVMGEGLRIMVDSPVGKALAKISKGDDILVSGFVLPGTDKDRSKGFPFQELSVTSTGALRNPELVFVPTNFYSNQEMKVPADVERAAIAPMVNAFLADQQAREAECRADLNCWGERFLIDANMACRAPVEGLSQYQFEWTDTVFEKKFDRWQRAAETPTVISYFGDRIKMQNGFGAWSSMIYRCDFDTEASLIVDVFASPGKF
jgi:transcription elongation GreA/GreB family factor